MTNEPNANDRRPASRRVADELRASIEAGEYPAGSQLPSYRTLVADWGVALGTAREAIRLLEQDGLVTIEQGRGAFVRSRRQPLSADVRLRKAEAEVTALRSELKEVGTRLSGIERRLVALGRQLRNLIH